MESRTMSFPARRVTVLPRKGRVYNLAQGPAPMIALALAVTPQLAKIAGSVIAGMEKAYFHLGEELTHMMFSRRHSASGVGLDGMGKK